MAARGINKAIIVGNLGADPETKYMPSGTAVANIRVATTEAWKDKSSGEQQERTEWHRIEAFGRLAEIMGEYLKKGSQVYIEGQIRTDKWQDREGNDRYTTKIVAREMQMLGGRGGAGGTAGFDDSAPAASRGSGGSGGGRQSQPVADDLDDDIPF